MCAGNVPDFGKRKPRLGVGRGLGVGDLLPRLLGEDVGNNGLIGAFEFAFNEGDEGVPLSWGDGLTAEGAGAVDAAAMDVDAEFAGVVAGLIAEHGDGSGLHEGFVTLSGGLAESMDAEFVAPDSGLKDGDGFALDTGIDVAVKTDEGGGGDDEEGVVVNAAIIHSWLAHGVAKVTTDADDGDGGGDFGGVEDLLDGVAFEARASTGKD